VIEYVWRLTPLEQLFALAGRGPVEGGLGGGSGKIVIRLGVASWQMDEFPWEETIRRYEQAHPGARIRLSILPEGALNSALLFWASAYTEYDIIVAWADEEIHPFIDYNWDTQDPRRRSLIINVNDYLTPQQLESFPPALFGGCARQDPQTGKVNRYELPWMGEVLALNYNKEFFARRGIARPPETWEEVEEVCKKLMGLEHNGNKVAALAMNLAQGGFFAQNCYIPMLAAYKDGRGITDARGRLDVSSPEAVSVFQTIKRWHQAGYISPNCMNNDTVEQDLRVMRAAMYAHWQSRGLWAVKDHGPKIIGIAATPGAKRVGSLVCTYGCIIPKCAPNIKAVVDFGYEAFCSDRYGFQSAVANGFEVEVNGKKVLKGGGKMPADKQMYARADLPPGVAELGKSLDRGYSYPDPANWGHSAEILVVEFQKFLTGTTATAEEALRNTQKRINEEVYGEQ
jgi:ABC-type glycerol-3-phosphate transport system substrate-binding protein